MPPTSPVCVIQLLPRYNWVAGMARPVLGIGRRSSSQSSWKLDLDDTYFRILDSKKYIAGYFDPDYGEDATEEQIESMLKRKAPVSGGYLVVPMLKFGLFDGDLDIDIYDLEDKMGKVNRALARWSGYMRAKNYPFHSVRISHTDQDMLTMTVPIAFRRPVRLDKGDLAAEISDTMESLQRQGLL